MSASVTSAVLRANPPALGPESPVAWPKRTVTTLGNGLQVVLVESHTFPKIAAQLHFRSGNVLVSHTAPGLAEITATVVRSGTQSRPSRKIEEELRRMGATLGTSSGADSSAISACGLAEFSSAMLELMADLAHHASFPAEDFERERRRRLEELKIERSAPGFVGIERLRRVLFGAHPYAVVAPTEDELAAITRDQLVAFYQKHYVPADSLLIVVGDFATVEMREQIEQIFGAWKAPKVEPTAFPAPPQQSRRRVHLVHRPGAVQTQVLLGNLSITRHDPDWYRLMLANSIFGGAFHSRLVLNIREQKGYTYSPASGVNALRRQGYFTVRAAVRNDVVAATLTEMFYEMDRMRSVPVTPDELSSAQSYLTGVFSLGVATQDGMLSQLATVYLDQLPEGYLETHRERIRALTAEDVMAAARRHFDSANAQVVVVGDREQIGEQAALFGPVTEYDAQGNEVV